MSGSASWRYERKFRLEGVTAAELESAVRRNPALFFEEFPVRDVNNIYLDTPELRHYHDNVHGIALRTKVRIRWYGNLFGSVARPILELKRKRGLMGNKESVHLPAFTLDGSLDRELLSSLLERSEMTPTQRALLRYHEPTLVNRYRRRYLRSADRSLRLTIDWALEFYGVSGRHNTFRRHVNDRAITVVELKYADGAAPSAERVTNSFPFRMTRMSKYVYGLDRLNR
jgi:hypothetical protein